MITTPIRVAVATTATAALLSLAAVVPATADTSYPHSWGTVTLYAGGLLQETSDVYPHHPEARNVVGSLGADSDQQKWTLEEVSPGVFHILSVTSGRALQQTNEANPAGGTNVVTTPASWNNSQQLWRITLNPDFATNRIAASAITNVASGHRLSLTSGRQVVAQHELAATPGTLGGQLWIIQLKP